MRGVDQVIVGDAPLPPFDAHMALLSLPRALGTTPATIPAAVPYVRAADERRAEARANLAARSERWKIGIAWAGSKAHTNDRNRSCSLAFLVPLFRVA